VNAALLLIDHKLHMLLRYIVLGVTFN